MESKDSSVSRVVAQELQPRVRVDGGDIEFERVDGDTIILGAYADCATCPAAPERLRWWCEQVFAKALGKQYAVVINQHIPYYGQ